VTELAVIEVTPDGLVLREIAEDVTPETIQKLTEVRLRVAPDLKKIAL
jgi:3-oxoacid CoA-transferase subunit B